MKKLKYTLETLTQPSHLNRPEPLQDSEEPRRPTALKESLLKTQSLSSGEEPLASGGDRLVKIKLNNKECIKEYIL
jgi:hypothetical protein